MELGKGDENPLNIQLMDALFQKQDTLEDPDKFLGDLMEHYKTNCESLSISERKAIIHFCSMTSIPFQSTRARSKLILSAILNVSTKIQLLDAEISLLKV